MLRVLGLKMGHLQPRNALPAALQDHALTCSRTNLVQRSSYKEDTQNSCHEESPRVTPLERGKRNAFSNHHTPPLQKLVL
jgi:hypothetical protein